MKHVETLLDRLQHSFDLLVGTPSFYTITADQAAPSLTLPKDVELPAVWRRGGRSDSYH